MVSKKSIATLVAIAAIPFVAALTSPEKKTPEEIVQQDLNERYSMIASQLPPGIRDEVRETRYSVEAMKPESVAAYAMDLERQKMYDRFNR